MQLENRFTVPVPIEQAWRALIDIEQVAPCMPGAALDTVNGDEFTGRVKVKLGPINLTYQGHASFIEKDHDAFRAVIDARGKDQRGNGTAAAVVTANLTAEGESTVVDVLTDLNITGRPAQFGRGVMTDVGNKLLGQFATNLAAQLGVGEAQAAGAPAAAAEKPGPAKVAAATVAGAAEEVAASAESVQGEGAAAQAVKKTAGAAKKAAASAADRAAPDRAAPDRAAAGKAVPEKAVAPRPTGEVLPAEEHAAAVEPVTQAADAVAATAPPPAKKAPSPPPAAATAPPPRAATGGPGKIAPPHAEPVHPAPIPAAPPQRRQAMEPEPIDLLEVAGGPALARLAPVLGAGLALVLIIWLIRRRSRG